MRTSVPGGVDVHYHAERFRIADVLGEEATVLVADSRIVQGVRSRVGVAIEDAAADVIVRPGASRVEGVGQQGDVEGHVPLVIELGVRAFAD
jgi:hypothetical protein